MSTLELVFGGTPPQFEDDSNRNFGLNGSPARAGIMAAHIILANQLAHAGHTIYSWCQGDLGTGLSITALELTSCFRQVYMPANKGANSEGIEILGTTHADESSPGFQDGQGFAVSIGALTFNAYWNFSTATAFDFPETARVQPLTGTYGYSTTPAEIIIGGVTSNWPEPVAGSMWQNPDDLIDSDRESNAGSADVHQKGEIVATRGTGVEHLTALINVFRDTWFHQRSQGGWSSFLPGQVDSGTAAIRGVHFNTSFQSFRYIFDQTYGSGGSTITATTPAMTLPLANAAGGRGTQVRVYVFVYAAMSGGTNSGEIGVANKSSSGTMAATATALTNGEIISGTTFQWYPTLATWSANTAPFFLAYTGSAFDRVALCARSSGTTDHVIVGAVTYVVAPSTT